MKTTLLVTISLAILATASPLGNRAVFKRHHDSDLVPHSRRFILQSRFDAPPACAALPLAKSKALSNSTATLDNSTSVADSSTADNTALIDPLAADNSTTVGDSSTADNTALPPTDDSSTADNTALPPTDDSSTADDTALPPTTDSSTADNTALPPTGDSSTADNTALPPTDSSTADNTALPGTTGDSSTVDNTALPATKAKNRRGVKHVIHVHDDFFNIAFTWQHLCLISGGDIFSYEPCIEYGGIAGINALLVEADPCDQQDNADAMITFAKSIGVRNKAALIASAISYRRHPRNAVSVLGVFPSTPYCLRTPINPELIGVWNEQTDGVNPGVFGSPSIPLMPFGESGTCPFGQTPDVATCSCVNNTDTSDSEAATETATADDSTATDTTSVDDGTTDTSTTADTTEAVADSTTVAASSTSAAAKATVTSAVAKKASAASSTSAPAKSTKAATPPAKVAPPPAKLAPPPAKVATPPAKVAPPPAAKSSGPNFQPPNISGDVNDVNG